MRNRVSVTCRWSPWIIISWELEVIHKQTSRWRVLLSHSTCHRVTVKPPCPRVNRAQKRPQTGEPRPPLALSVISLGPVHVRGFEPLVASPCVCAASVLSAGRGCQQEGKSRVYVVRVWTVPTQARADTLSAWKLHCVADSPITQSENENISAGELLELKPHPSKVPGYTIISAPFNQIPIEQP